MISRRQGTATSLKCAPPPFPFFVQGADQALMSLTPLAGKERRRADERPSSPVPEIEPVAVLADITYFTFDALPPGSGARFYRFPQNANDAEVIDVVRELAKRLG